MKAILILIIEKKSIILEIFYGYWYLFMKYKLLTKCDYNLLGCVLWYYNATTMYTSFSTENQLDISSMRKSHYDFS